MTTIEKKGGPRRFRDRWDAGRALADRVAQRVDPANTVVLALPRGGVPVARAVADRIGAPLDVLLVRKLGVPWQPELAFGAVAAGDVVVFDHDVLRLAPLAPRDIEAVAERERAELARRERLYRGGRPPLDVVGKTVVVVDDGIATGSTVRAALEALARLGAARRIVATPVAPPETVELLRREADDVICLQTPRDLVAIGYWYRDFGQVSDEEVLRLLNPAAATPTTSDPTSPSRTSSVEIPVGDVRLVGDLTTPAGATVVVVFAHGSGSSRLSPRNRFVAERLNEEGLATLLFDLLTSDEERVDDRTREYRFDIGLLARRLVQVTDWLTSDESTRGLTIGYFGASTGAAAALVAASARPDAVGAVVSRGGRPDLAGDALAGVRAPTLLIVGGKDDLVIGLNRDAMARMPADTPKEIQIVAGATHLFPETGALERVADLAAAWLSTHLIR